MLFVDTLLRFGSCTNYHLLIYISVHLYISLIGLTLLLICYLVVYVVPEGE